VIMGQTWSEIDLIILYSATLGKLCRGVQCTEGSLYVII